MDRNTSQLLPEKVVKGGYCSILAINLPSLDLCNSVVETYLKCHEEVQCNIKITNAEDADLEYIVEGYGEDLCISSTPVNLSCFILVPQLSDHQLQYYHCEE